VNQALLGAAAAILCVLIGHFLTRWSQHKQWLRDRKLEEFRELVSAMTKAIVDTQHLVACGAPDLGEQWQKTFEVQKDALRTLADRIFIRDELESIKFLDDYMKAFEDIRKDKDIDKFGPRMDAVMNAVIKSAQEI